jgi:hypothetical protein
MNTCMLILLPAIAWAEPKSGIWSEEVDVGQGRYTLDFDGERSVVEFAPRDAGAAPPAAVKLRIHRKKGPPLDLHLHTLIKPETPVRYEGELREWQNQSVVGFELDVSFDKKTWKKVKRFFSSK